jgi:hypothetical protein
MRHDFTHGALANRAQAFLGVEEIKRVAPSVFAEEPHGGVSSRYAFVPTTRVLAALAEAGWLPVRAQENRVRLADKSGYQRHMLRLRHRDAAQGLMRVGDSFPEIVLTNSHDGLAAFGLDAGLFRLVCSNGLVVADSQFESARIKHVGYRDEDVIDVTARVIDAMPQLVESVERLQEVQLDRGEQLALAAAATELRWPSDEDGKTAAPIRPEQLLKARRHDDDGSSVWHAFNRIQENLMQGGLRGRGATGRRTSTRAVASVNEDIRLNKALWVLAERLADAKRAA